MSNSIVLKKGLDIPIKGAAALKTTKKILPDVVAIKPDDFKGFLPRVLVKEGDRVLAGSPVLSDKRLPDILVCSPVSGTVQEVARGDKRKLLAVLVKADEKQESVDLGAKDIEGLSPEQVRDTILASGLWPSIIQRPYGIVADPALRPKAIFVSAFDTAPLAPDTDYVLGSRIQDIQAGVQALSKLTDGGVHIGLDSATEASTPFHKIEGAAIHTFTGKHPAGNVGVQISHISPIAKGETVWTVSPLLLAAIGHVFATGKVDLSRKVAVTGPRAIEPAYVDAFPGMPVKALEGFYDNAAGDIRFVSGDVLTGKNVGPDGYLGWFDNQVTLLHEGTEREILGWAKIFRPKVFSSSKAFFSWLCPRKKYDMDTNLHGGKRAFVLSDQAYSKVLPMDIFPLYLVKACLAGNIEDMEKYGIYEVLPEDLALCEYADPSKNDIQAIIEDGIDLMLKEMA
ncbi:MAG: Na(+)-translocating NADH-quinone reductase subunit A [Bacteroidales bacterium]|nr:Na(+)-translocating NADH-quinone reductase subunit A [Bacteroidales bacterium]